MTASVAEKLDTVVKRLYTNGAPKVGGERAQEILLPEHVQNKLHSYYKGVLNEIFQYPILACGINDIWKKDVKRTSLNSDHCSLSPSALVLICCIVCCIL